MSIEEGRGWGRGSNSESFYGKATQPEIPFGPLTIENHVFDKNDLKTRLFEILMNALLMTHVSLTRANSLNIKLVSP